MKNYFQIPLFAIAVVIVLMVVGDAIAQSNQRGSSSRPSSYPGFTPKSSGSSTRSGSGARPYIPPSRGASSPTRSRRSTRNPEESLVRKSEEPVSAEARTALEELAAIQNKLVANRKPVSYTHLTLPTKRIV